MTLQKLIQQKIIYKNHAHIIEQYSHGFTLAEQQLLNSILNEYQFNEDQSEALAQATYKQSKLKNQHIDHDDDENSTGTCAHCMNPPAPPLQDYALWRQRQSKMK